MISILTKKGFLTLFFDSVLVYFHLMNERLYPVVLAAISESGVRLKWTKDKEEYDAFYAMFGKPGTEFREIKTLRTIFAESKAKYVVPHKD
jgi:hypothetical protein